MFRRYNLPPGYTFLQSLWRTYKQVKDPVGSMQESMEKFNGTYTVNLGTHRLVATQDPGFMDYVLKTNHRNYNKSFILTEKLGRFIGKGLLTANGEYWLRQRRLIQPGFHAEKIQSLYSIIKQTTDDFLKEFPCGMVEIYSQMNKLAFEIVINTLFNIRVPAETRKALSNFITETQDFVIKDIRQPHKSWWFSLAGEVKKNLKNAERSRDIIRAIIRERKESREKFNDLLDMLLDARHEDTGRPMEEEQVIDEILILLIAGHETTANALTWTLYLLATHPHELDKARKVTASLNANECVTHNSLLSVIYESMRLYPPAWISDRVSLEDDAYGNFEFPKGTVIILFYYGLHRDPQYWNDPGSFIPERFSVPVKGREKQKAFYPFGAGPRLCIGNNFALAEMTIFLQAMIHQFEIRPTNTKPSFRPLVTLRPEKVLLEISRR